MKTKIRALTSFMHGRLHAHVGDEVEVSKGDADDLVKAGMAEVSGADDGVDDLLGDTGRKMDDAPKNKMEAEPENKADSKAKTSVKAK